MNHASLQAYRVLVVPGLHGSGPDHWQTRWERRYPSFQRVQQHDWSKPDLPQWSHRLQQVLRESDHPTLIVAHSFGCLTTMHAASCGRFNLAGVLLVAPADPDKFGVADALRSSHIRCPAIVIGSVNDPWMDAARAAYWADNWRCGFVNAGSLGHINADSGLGDWEQGLQQFGYLLDMADTLAAIGEN